MTPNLNANAANSNGSGDARFSHSEKEGNYASETDLPIELERSIRQLADTAGNLESEVVASAVAADGKRRPGEPQHSESLRESLVRRLAIAKQRLLEASDRLSLEQPTIAKRNWIIALLSPKTILLLLVLGVIVFLENTCAAIIVRNVAAFGITNMWVARGVCATPIPPALVLALAIWLLPILLRRKILVGAFGMLLLAFAVWAAGFAIEVSRCSSESGAGFYDALQNSFVAPAAEWPALIMFAASVVMLATSTFLGHVALEVRLRSSGDREKNPYYVEAEADMREAEAEIVAIEKEIASLDKTLASHRAEQSYAIQIAKTYYKFLRRNGGTLGTLVIAIVFAVGCGDSSPGALDKDTTAADHYVVAIPPELDDAAKNDALKAIARAADWTCKAAPGSTIVIMNGQRGGVITRFIAVDGVRRLRKKALLEPMRDARAFLGVENESKDDHKDERSTLGCVNMPCICKAISQLDERPSRVCILGSPLFNSQAENDKPFSMLGGKVPSPGYLFASPTVSPFSVQGRENTLYGNWFFGWEDGSVFNGELHQHAVLSLWINYVSLQGANVVYAGESFSGAIDSMLHNKSPRPLTCDEPDRSAPLEMIVVKTKSNERVEEQTVDIVDQQTSFKHVGQQIQNQQSNDNEPKQDKTELRCNVLILAFNNDPGIRTSPLPDILRNAGFRVASLNHPLPPIERFNQILNQAREVWVIASPQPDLLPDSHLQSVVERWRAGKIGLALFADNAPHLHQSQATLSAICPGVRLEGNDVGRKTVFARSDTALAGFDHDSPLFKGIDSGLWEGETISSINSSECSHAVKPKTVCLSSAGKPLIATFEMGRSRCIIHCGFTALYSRFLTAGTSKFVVNAAKWLDPIQAEAGRNPDENAAIESSK